MCVELGIRKLAIPSAGNAASALAAYAAAAGIEAHIFMPQRRAAGQFHRMQGLWGACDAGGRPDQRLRPDRGRTRPAEGWFDVSTLKEPYRIEGKKTMGYEVAEQLGWELPDAIFYPTGGGVGMIGMWKAFDEMEALGWIGPKRPKMIAVQAEGCQPVVRAFQRRRRAQPVLGGAATVASGLRVPKPLGDFLVLKAVRESGGTAIAVPDTELIDAGIQARGRRGHLRRSRKAAACVAAAERLIREGFLKRDDQIVIYNTGSGLKYLEAYSTRFPARGGAARRTNSAD